MYYLFIKTQFYAEPPSPLEGDNQGKFLILGKEGYSARRMTEEYNFPN